MIDFLDRLFTSAAPLAIASTGALFTELAGALGIFTEGFMSAGAFFAWVLTGWTGSAFWGTSITVCAAFVTGWALARVVRKTKANPFIAGLVVNIAAAGITASLSQLWFGTRGVLRNPHFVSPNHLLPVYASLIIVILAEYFIAHTPWGLRLRASGLSPEAAKERGIRPGLYWEAAWAVSAFLAALAGAFLCFKVGSYTPGSIAGRGWISLAAVYLGFRRPGGILAAALVFALAEMAAQKLQSFPNIPATALLGLPNALALLLYVFFRHIKTKTPI